MTDFLYMAALFVMLCAGPGAFYPLIRLFTKNSTVSQRLFICGLLGAILYILAVSFPYHVQGFSMYVPNANSIPPKTIWDIPVFAMLGFLFSLLGMYWMTHILIFTSLESYKKTPIFLLLKLYVITYIVFSMSEFDNFQKAFGILLKF